MRYLDYLRNLPASGGGGCHGALLGAANLGIRAGLSAQQIARDLRASVHGPRHVPDHEIAYAVAKASSTEAPVSRRRSHNTRSLNGEVAREVILQRGCGATEADLWESSPVRIDWDPDEDAWRVLQHLYRGDEYLFIGDDQIPGRVGVSIRRASEWIQHLRRIGAPPYPKFIPNTLSGLEGMTKDGRPSFRADACVAAHRFVLCEFDQLSIEDQLAFWSAVTLPVGAIVHSGNKSLHAWVYVDCVDASEWEREVESDLFPLVFAPLGLDQACKNEARLSRLPGHIRPKTRQRQRLLYLAPGGRAVSAS